MRILGVFKLCGQELGYMATKCECSSFRIFHIIAKCPFATSNIWQNNPCLWFYIIVNCSFIATNISANTYCYHNNHCQQGQKLWLECPEQCKLHPKCKQPLCAGRWIEDLHWQHCCFLFLLRHKVGGRLLALNALSLQNCSSAVCK